MIKKSYNDDSVDKYIDAVNIVENDTNAGVILNVGKDKVEDIDDYIRMISDVSKRDVIHLKKTEKNEKQFENYVKSFSQQFPNSIILAETDDELSSVEEQKKGSNLGLLLWWLMNRDKNYRMIGDPLDVFSVHSGHIDISNLSAQFINPDDLSYTVKIFVYDSDKLNQVPNATISVDGRDYYADSNDEYNLNLSFGVHDIEIIAPNYKPDSITISTQSPEDNYSEYSIFLHWASIDLNYVDEKISPMINNYFTNVDLIQAQDLLLNVGDKIEETVEWELPTIELIQYSDNVNDVSENHQCSAIDNSITLSLDESTIVIIP